LKSDKNTLILNLANQEFVKYLDNYIILIILINKDFHLMVSNTVDLLSFWCTVTNYLINRQNLLVSFGLAVSLFASHYDAPLTITKQSEVENIFF